MKNIILIFALILSACVFQACEKSQASELNEQITLDIGTDYYHYISSVVEEWKTDSNGVGLLKPETDAMGNPTGNYVPDVVNYPYGLTVLNQSASTSSVSISEIKTKVASCRNINDTLIITAWKIHDYVSLVVLSESNFCQ